MVQNQFHIALARDEDSFYLSFKHSLVVGHPLPQGVPLIEVWVPECLPYDPLVGCVASTMGHALIDNPNRLKWSSFALVSILIFYFNTIRFHYKIEHKTDNMNTIFYPLIKSQSCSVLWWDRLLLNKTFANFSRDGNHFELLGLMNSYAFHELLLWAPSCGATCAHAYHVEVGDRNI